MGLGGYFKPKKAAAPHDIAPQMMEKPPSRLDNNFELSTAVGPKFGSSRASLAPSTNSSTYVDEIKHEVMVNYLYQQQCSHLWVNDSSGEFEGVLLRKSRNSYMACPPQLATSTFGMACAALNVQVSSPPIRLHQSVKLTITGRHDGELSSHQSLPRMVSRRR